ncbi:DegQ family serine endoprotease [Alphaproteobacteria bacterium]|nr:DegQ family serine endoprotease [Alphaproteobacteria bacterium]
MKNINIYRIKLSNINNKNIFNIYSSTLFIFIFIQLFLSNLALSTPLSFANLAEKLKPAVVNVSTTQSMPESHSSQRPQVPPGSPFEEFFKEFFDRHQQENGSPMPQRRKQSLGSGFIIDPSGLVVTNNHVIANADEIEITLDDNKTYSASILGRDSKTDLALLKIDNPSKIIFPFVKWGNSDISRVGDWVIAIGNPFGLGGSVTAGIISARGRNINAGPYDNFIQTDAAINRGNSGGPMFNLDGEVIGINTAIFSPSGGSVGIGFAIPANMAQKVVSQLKNYGKTQRGWLGVQIQTVTEEIAESLSLGSARGALISRVEKGGPASLSGLIAGDIILEFAGKKVETMRQLPRIVADTKIGERVKVEIWRKGRKKTLTVLVGELKEAMVSKSNQPKTMKPKSEKTKRILGMTLALINTKNSSEFNLRSGIRGILVKKVDVNGPAAERGIRPGDVIVEINQKSVDSLVQLENTVNKVKKLGRKTVLLFIERSGNLRFVPIKITE